MDKCFVILVLALIACSHAILSTEGRQLKYKEKEETAEQGSRGISLQQNAAGLKEDLQSTKPSVDIPSAENTVSMTGEKEIFPPMSFGASATVYQHGFRPTPGNSPGVGHKHAKEEEDVESKFEGDHSLNGGQSASANDENSRPTAPGHGPRVGPKHAKEEEDFESKFEGDYSPNGGHSAPANDENSRPTAPGHGPRVGHLLSNKSAEPKA